MNTTAIKAQSVIAAFLLSFSLSAQAQVFRDSLVQPPELAPPQRGSLAGQYSKVAFGPGDVARGEFTLASPFSAPIDRGPLLASVFPSYEPEGGISEWGMGWQTSLALMRWRVAGDIDYQTDDLTGPFGHLTRGTDGNWYPVGLQTPTRVLPQASGDFIAYLPDGSQWTFGGASRIETALGTYAWYLSEVQTATGRKTRIEYDRNPSSRLYVKTVYYGGVGDDFQYQINFDYESIPAPFADYRTGMLLLLDRRVQQVTVKVKNSQTLDWAERWHYALQYQGDDWGPGFYLTQVRQTFASGESLPPVGYGYSHAADTLSTAQFRRASKLDSLISELGRLDFLEPHRAALLDINLDGRADFETNVDNTLYVQEEDGFRRQPLADPVGDLFPPCRPAPSEFNSPRALAQLRVSDDSYQVVRLLMDRPSDATELSVCTREGMRLLRQPLPTTLWELGPNTRLVDLNRDHQPDLLRVFSGGYQVIPNLSDATQFRFGEVRSGTLDIRGDPSATWAQDMNGDGIPDIVARYNGLTVYFGLGNFEFLQQGKTFELVNASGHALSDLSGYELTFVDANRDGLTDVILVSGQEAHLFVNTGADFPCGISQCGRMMERPVPAFSFIERGATRPVVGGLAGSGNTELVLIKNALAYALSLDAPETGLLASADDGKGNVLRFDYARSPAADGTRQRQPVLVRLTVESSGQDTVRYDYAYQGPRVHSLGKFLLGFDEVTRQDLVSTHVINLLNTDSYSGVLISASVHDVNSPLVDKTESREYEDVVFQNILWKRPSAAVSGWRNQDGSLTISNRTAYLAYQNDVCPQRIREQNEHGTLVTEKTRASPTGLVNHLHCLDERIVLTGTHSDVAWDFRHEALIQRNSIGLAERVQALGSGPPLTLEQVFYNSDYTIDRITSPGRGTTWFAYEAGTRLLRQITFPDLRVVQVTERDPVNDAIRATLTDRGATAFSTFFRYDALERLSKQWDDLNGASESNPNKAYAYRYATSTQPGLISASTLVDATAGVARSEIDFATAAGDGLARARQIPEGWVFDGVTERRPSQNEVVEYVRPTFSDRGVVDIFQLDYPGLLAGARQISSARVSVFGHYQERTGHFHSDVERRITQALSLDASNLVETTIENDAFTTVRTLDAAKRATTFEDEARTHYGYRYDALGRLKEISLPDGTKHRALYDDRGRVRSVEREGIAIIDYTYDGTTGLLTRKRLSSPLREPETQTQAQREVTWEYDAIGRKSVETYTDSVQGSSETYEYFYDGSTPDVPAQTARGLLTAVRGNGYVKLFEYRADGLLTRRTVSIRGWRSVETTLSYYEDGSAREKSTTLKNSIGDVLSVSAKRFEYDAWGRVWKFHLNGALLGSFGYNENGQPSSADFVGESSLTFDYDDLSRSFVGLTLISPTWTASSGIRMNARGLLERETIGVNTLNLTRTYGYSPPGFLTSADDAQSSYRYQFDASGLPTAIEENGDRRQLVQVGDTLTVGGVDYRFDAFRRTIQKGDLQFTYGPNGHLSTARRGATEWTFLYDEAGERLVKLASGVPVAGYFEEGYLDGSGLVEPITAGGRLMGIVRLGVVQLLPVDSRGTVTADRDGTPRIPSPFGNRAVHPDLAAVVDYVQKGYDADLGVVRMGVRDYDPFINRFLTPDPLYLEDLQQCLRTPLGCNLFSYAHDAPTVYVDPDGRNPLLIALGVGALLGGGFYLLTTPKHQWSWGGLGLHALGGAVSAGIAVATAGGSLAAQGAAGVVQTFARGAAVGVAAGLANRAIVSKGDFGTTFSPAAVLTDATIGGVSSGVAAQFGGAGRAASSTTISKEVFAAEGTAATRVGTTVIGHFPEYLRLAEELGASRFSIAEEVWQAMSPAERWAANQQFLDAAISRGDAFRLATRLSEMRPGTYFAREVEYLMGRGYVLDEPGMTLLPGRR